MPIGEVFRHIFSAAPITGELTWDYYVIAAVYCLAVVLLGVIVAKVLKAVFLRLAVNRKKTRTPLGERILASLAGPLQGGVIVGSLYAAWALYPYSPPVLDSILGGVLFVLAALVGARLLVNPVLAFFRWYAEEAERKSGVVISTDFIPLIRKVLTVAVYAIGVIIVLEHFGVDIVALVTALGVASLAVALAAQDTLANMISGFVLMADRPFRNGDRVKVAGVYGDVKRIGMRSTDIVTLDGNTVTVPNSKISDEYIENFSQPSRRYRIVLEIGLAYGTDPERAEEVILESVRATDGVLKKPEPAVYFLTFGDFSLNFTLTCWCKSYAVSWVVTNAVNVNLARALAGSGLEIPFPTRTIHLPPGSTARKLRP
ncbi:MAG TPA: mechanosensitive ion channel family protein [bacterium]|nr:mechanosensitive ion channel family protein [bacterium]